MLRNRCKANPRPRSKPKAPSRQQRWPIKTAEPPADQNEPRRVEPGGPVIIALAAWQREPPAAADCGQRKIIHVDMDAFYASVEQRDNPDLRGKPVAVGGSRERGVVAAASYEARKFGVRSAMPSVTAKRQCPDLIFVKPRFEVYKAVSQQIREIFAEHTPIIEPLSLDEAYLDVTENLQGIPLARDVALAIRAKIKEVTGLNASAGISTTSFWRNSPPTIASLTASTSSRPRWVRRSSRRCPSENSTASGPRPAPR
jgi:hypothetical protein